MAARQAEPRDDIISRFVHNHIDDEPVPSPMVAAMIAQFIFGGVDTTASFISTALVHLHDHPEQRDWLRADPSRLPGAIKELLRCFSTAQHAARTVVEPVEVGGQRLEAGDRVMLSWAAANHDPARFDEPDMIRLDRDARRHMAFGVSAHSCMGMHLGRTESRIIIAEILSRLPDYCVVPNEAQRYMSIGSINGWVRVPITFTPGQHRRVADRSQR